MRAHVLKYTNPLIQNNGTSPSWIRGSKHMLRENNAINKFTAWISIPKFPPNFKIQKLPFYFTQQILNPSILKDTLWTIQKIFLY